MAPMDVFGTSYCGCFGFYLFLILYSAEIFVYGPILRSKVPSLRVFPDLSDRRIQNYQLSVLRTFQILQTQIEEQSSKATKLLRRQSDIPHSSILHSTLQRLQTNCQLTTIAQRQSTVWKTNLSLTKILTIVCVNNAYSSFQSTSHHNSKSYSIRKTIKFESDKTKKTVGKRYSRYIKKSFILYQSLCPLIERRYRGNS